jgi:hypothetical protein
MSADDEVHDLGEEVANMPNAEYIQVPSIWAASPAVRAPMQTMWSFWMRN